jgi:NADH dehydrogenase FAD-containing subunit
LSDGIADEAAIVGAGPTGLLLAGDLAAAASRARCLSAAPANRI